MQLYRRIMIVLMLVMVCPGCSGCVREEAEGIRVSDYAGQYDSDVQELIQGWRSGMPVDSCPGMKAGVIPMTIRGYTNTVPN